jgi:hypothetical protein
VIHALAIATALLAPDCQRLCLGKCWWDWQLNYCYDTRVVRLGEWDPLPWGYEPPREGEFPAWVLPYPKQWGEYPMEKQMSSYDNDAWAVP